MGRRTANWWDIINPAPTLPDEDDIHSPKAHPFVILCVVVCHRPSKVYPPGRILHFIQHTKSKMRERAFSMVWADREGFQTILVAGRMLGLRVSFILLLLCRQSRTN